LSGGRAAPQHLPNWMIIKTQVYYTAATTTAA